MDMCFVCEVGELSERTLDFAFSFGGYSLVHRVDGLVCNACGERMFALETIETVERESSCIVLSERPVTGAVVRDARRVLGLAPSELAGLLGLTDEDVARYEESRESVPKTLGLALFALCSRQRDGLGIEGALAHPHVTFVG
jgi:YgiT-type zinc finger domain-containing protein